jgi:hypothetical protein
MQFTLCSRCRSAKNFDPHWMRATDPWIETLITFYLLFHK